MLHLPLDTARSVSRRSSLTQVEISQDQRFEGAALFLHRSWLGMALLSSPTFYLIIHHPRFAALPIDMAQARSSSLLHPTTAAAVPCELFHPSFAHPHLQSWWPSSSSIGRHFLSAILIVRTTLLPSSTDALLWVCACMRRTGGAGQSLLHSLPIPSVMTLSVWARRRSSSSSSSSLSSSSF